MLGKEIEIARKKKHLTQVEFAKEIFINRLTLSSIEADRSSVNFAVMASIVQNLNDPRLTIAAINKLTGGAFGVKNLDGDNVDLHRSSVKEKVIEELQEAIDAIKISKIYQNPQAINGNDKKIIRKSIQEVIDVFNASGTYVQIVCEEYGFDVIEMFKEQENKMIERGYIKK